MSVACVLWTETGAPSGVKLIELPRFLGLVWLKQIRQGFVWDMQAFGFRGWCVWFEGIRGYSQMDQMEEREGKLDLYSGLSGML